MHNLMVQKLFQLLTAFVAEEFIISWQVPYRQGMSNRVSLS